MTKSKKIGIALIVIPPVLLVLTLSGYAIASFVAAKMIQEPSIEMNADTLGFGQIINAIFGLLGLLGVMGIFIGVPLGIYFLVRKEKGAPVAQPMQPPQNPVMN